MTLCPENLVIHWVDMSMLQKPKFVTSIYLLIFLLQIEEYSDIYAFIAKNLGLNWQDWLQDTCLDENSSGVPPKLTSKYWPSVCVCVLYVKGSYLTSTVYS